MLSSSCRRLVGTKLLIRSTATRRSPPCALSVPRSFSTAMANNNNDVSSELPPLPDCSQPLGCPMPVDEHACSVSLPSWASVVGYEEGNPAVVTAMQCGYPRFVYHPYVLQLMKHILEQHATNIEREDCLLLPSIHAARRCQIFLLRALYGDEADLRWNLPDPATVGHQPAEQVAADAAQTSADAVIRVVSVNDNQRAAVHAVVFPATTAAGTQAKAYWQHTGEVVSSRRAQACLQDLEVPLQKTVTQEQFTCHDHDTSTAVTSDDAWTQLRQSLAGWAGTSADDVILTPSGMSAIYGALQSARRRHLELYPHRQGGRSIVYGFPYLDTLKLCSRNELCPDGVEFFGRADAKDLATLESYLEANPNEISIVLTEVPSNPLLHCPNVVKLRQLADKHNFLLVVDDTIANFLNVDLFSSGLADAAVSSLTKLVSGRGDAMAGSIVCNPHTAGGQWMQQDFARNAEGAHSGLYCPDAMAILRNAQDFPTRNAQINQTTEALADWLANHDAVKHVYYPKLSHSVDLFHQVQHRPQPGHVSAGYGGLFSLVLADHMCERTFYDALDVAKGPSLGTNFTLVCPYTLLAHYHELDFAMSYDVPPNLIRVAVGLEPLEILREKFGKALQVSQLYPKVCMDTVERRKQAQSSSQKREFSTTRAASRPQTPCSEIGSYHSTPCACKSCCCEPSYATATRQPNTTMSLRSWTPSRFGSLRLA